MQRSWGLRLQKKQNQVGVPGGAGAGFGYIVNWKGWFKAAVGWKVKVWMDVMQLGAPLDVLPAAGKPLPRLEESRNPNPHSSSLPSQGTKVRHWVAWTNLPTPRLSHPS